MEYLTRRQNVAYPDCAEMDSTTYIAVDVHSTNKEEARGIVVIIATVYSMHPFIHSSDSCHLVSSILRPMLHIRNSITVQTFALTHQQRPLPYASLQQPHAIPNPDAIANFAITTSHTILRESQPRYYRLPAPEAGGGRAGKPAPSGGAPMGRC